MNIIYWIKDQGVVSYSKGDFPGTVDINIQGNGKHWFLRQPPLSEPALQEVDKVAQNLFSLRKIHTTRTVTEEINAPNLIIDAAHQVFRDRLRTLLSVDDLVEHVVGLVDQIDQVGEMVLAIKNVQGSRPLSVSFLFRTSEKNITVKLARLQDSSISDRVGHC